MDFNKMQQNYSIGILHTNGDLDIKRSKVKVTMIYSRNITKNVNVAHNFVQPSCISMKLSRGIPKGILHTCGDIYVKVSKVKVTILY